MVDVQVFCVDRFSVRFEKTLANVDAKERRTGIKMPRAFERVSKSLAEVDGQRFLNGSGKRRPADPRITYLNAPL